MQKAATPSYVLTVTNKNRKRELERTRRQAAGKAVDSRRKRSRKSHPIIADSHDEESGVGIEDRDGGGSTRLQGNDASDSHGNDAYSVDVVLTL
jgi:hypothetical protein